MPLSNSNLFQPMFSAHRTAAPRFSAMHLAMQDRVYRLDMIRSTAAFHVALVMDVFAGRTVQGLINETVHLPEPAADPDMAIPVTVLGCSPNPALAINGDARVEAYEVFVRKHPRSIQLPGFIATGSVHDSADPKGIARNTGESH